MLANDSTYLIIKIVTQRSLHLNDKFLVKHTIFPIEPVNFCRNTTKPLTNIRLHSQLKAWYSFRK